MKRVKNPVFLLALLAASFVLLSIIPDLTRLKHTPAGTVFPLVHNHPDDYFYYLSLMRQGFDGHWLLTTYMTPESFTPAFVHTFYAFTGHLAKWFHLSLVNVYFFSRIILGFVLILSSFFLAHKIFGSKKGVLQNNVDILDTPHRAVILNNRKDYSGTSPKYFVWTCLFLLINNSFWFLKFNNGQYEFQQFLSFWTRLDPIMRITYIPHHLLSTILAVWSVYFLVIALEKNLLRYCLLAGLLGFLAGFVYFATMLSLLGGLGTAVLIVLINQIINFIRAGDARRRDPDSTQPTIGGEYWRERNLRQDPRILRQDPLFLNKLMLIAVYVALAGLSLVYIFYISRSGFPWSGYNKVAVKFTFSFKLWEYLLSLGPFFILMVIGLKVMFKKLTFLSLILLGWAIFPILGIPLFRFFLPQLGDVYFLETATYIPIGILAGFGAMYLETIFTKHQKIISTLILVAILLYSLVPFYFSLTNEPLQFTKNFYNIYVPNDIMKAFKWLDKNSPDKSVVLAGGFIGNLIPAFTHDKVVYGHPANTYASTKKKEDAYLVFSPKNETDRPAILKKYSVSYIFYSRDTDAPRQELIDKWNFKKVFNSLSTSIYEKN